MSLSVSLCIDMNKYRYTDPGLTIQLVMVGHPSSKLYITALQSPVTIMNLSLSL